MGDYATTLTRWEDEIWSLAGQEYLVPYARCDIFFLIGISIFFPPTSKARNSMSDDVLALAI